MINLTTANNALKTVYLDVLDNLLNTATNPLFSRIKQSSEGVYGKEVRVMAPYGLSGGITATSETGELPKAGNNNYAAFTTELKNLYGRIEISDKAVRASQNSAGAFVNLLNDEMEGLIKASALNLSRMLYGYGKGLITEIVNVSEDGKTVQVSSTNALMEGMIVDVVDEASQKIIDTHTQILITGVDRVNKKVIVDKPVHTVEYINEGGFFFATQGSYNNELLGLESLFNDNVVYLYGLSKPANPFMKGRAHNRFGEFDEMSILQKIDEAEENSSAKVNFISTTSGIRRKYQSILLESGRNIQTVDLGNGFKAVDFYGVPMVSDRFVPENQMYIIDTDKFTLHQMCDWEWMTDDGGNVLSKKDNYPVYTATLVKYAELICNCPNGQTLIRDLTV